MDFVQSGLFPSSLVLSVNRRRHAHLLLEESAESRGIGKVQQVGNLLNALVGGADERDSLLGDGLEYELLHGAARHRLDERREVFGRQTQAVGIEAHAAFADVVAVYELHELHEGVELAARFVVAVLRQLAEYAAEPVGQREQKQPSLVRGKHVVVAVAGSQQFRILRQLRFMSRRHHPTRSRVEDVHESHPHHRTAQDVAYGVHAIQDYRHGAVVAPSRYGEVRPVGEDRRFAPAHLVFRILAAEREAALGTHDNPYVGNAEIIIKRFREVPYRATRAADILISRHLPFENPHVVTVSYINVLIVFFHSVCSLFPAKILQTEDISK